MWINAASQSFNSLGIAFGAMISFASFNKYNNNILHDTLAVSSVNIITSILVGVLSFATLGNIAYEKDLPIGKILIKNNLSPGIMKIRWFEADFNPSIQ